MTDNLLYHEKLTSAKTEALFLALTLLFLALALWRVDSLGLDGLAIAFAVFFGLFLFYSLNYRTLIIHLTSESLTRTSRKRKTFNHEGHEGARRKTLKALPLCYFVPFVVNFLAFCVSI